MAEPSLSEITNIRGNGDIALGTSGSAASAAMLPYNTEGLRTLQSAAESKVRNDQWKYEQYQKRLAELNTRFTKDFNLGSVRNAELPGVTEQYKSVLQEYADNPGLILNPLSNPQKWAEIGKKETELKSRIQASSYLKAVEDLNGDMLKVHPELMSPENQAKLAASRGMSVEELTADPSALILDKPLTFDPAIIGKTAAENTKQTFTSNEKNRQKMIAAGFNPKDKSAVDMYLISHAEEVYDPAIYEQQYRAVSKGASASNVGVSHDDVYYNLYKKNGGTGTKDSEEFQADYSKFIRAQIPKGDVTQKIEGDEMAYKLKALAVNDANDDADRALRRAQFNESTRQYYQDKADGKDAEAGSLAVQAYTNLLSGRDVDSRTGQILFGSKPGEEIEVEEGTTVGYPGTDGYTKTTSKTKIPKIQYAGTYINSNGDAVVRTIDYSKKRKEPLMNFGVRVGEREEPGLIEERVMTPAQIKMASYGIDPKKSNTLVEKEAAKFLRDKKLDPYTTPIQTLDQMFNIPKAAPSADAPSLTPAQKAANAKVKLW